MPNLIYFGNFPNVDTAETTPAEKVVDENASVLAGVTRSGKAELQTVSATVTDPESDGAVTDDEFNNSSSDGNNPAQDQVSYTLDGGSPTTTITEASMRFSATITLSDGSTLSQNVIVLQMQNGDVFINDLLSGPQLDNRSIQSIELVARNASFTGWQSAQSINSAQIVCFEGGSLITTDQGERPAHSLAVGDLVLTRDAGFQPVLWVFNRHFSAADLAKDDRRLPVRIRAQTLGDGQPYRDLLVSRQHRVLLSADKAMQMFGSSEILAAAIKLRDYDGIEIAEDVGEVTYVHLMLARHHVVYANGLPSESMYDGKLAIGNLNTRQKLTLLAARPDVFECETPPERARPFVENRKQIKALFQDTRPTAPRKAAPEAVMAD